MNDFVIMANGIMLVLLIFYSWIITPKGTNIPGEFKIMIIVLGLTLAGLILQNLLDTEIVIQFIDNISMQDNQSK